MGELVSILFNQRRGMYEVVCPSIPDIEDAFRSAKCVWGSLKNPKAELEDIDIIHYDLLLQVGLACCSLLTQADSNYEPYVLWMSKAREAMLSRISLGMMPRVSPTRGINFDEYDISIPHSSLLITNISNYLRSTEPVSVLIRVYIFAFLNLMLRVLHCTMHNVGLLETALTTECYRLGLSLEGEAKVIYLSDPGISVVHLRQ